VSSEEEKIANELPLPLVEFVPRSIIRAA
jgi:hypothetical protein